ncbi:hypothetical protein PUN28_006595 [Cardiocondyla obscurior]|uniref:Uncharacterized protein n=1 Tax=Cardiocondyla obscurior TaxID=286306 RepID=A0AAW2GBD9_9HYME
MTHKHRKQSHTISTNDADAHQTLDRDAHFTYFAMLDCLRGPRRTARCNGLLYPATHTHATTLSKSNAANASAKKLFSAFVISRDTAEA